MCSNEFNQFKKNCVGLKRKIISNKSVCHIWPILDLTCFFTKFVCQSNNQPLKKKKIHNLPGKRTQTLLVNHCNIQILDSKHSKIHSMPMHRFEVNYIQEFFV
jgi:hypothetical protein